MTVVIQRGESVRSGSERPGPFEGSRAGMTTAELLAWMPRLHALGGPRACLYPAFDRWNHEVARRLRSGAIVREQVDATILSLGQTYLEETVMGHVFLRPHGYAGDYETIEAFYRGTIASDPRCARWDRFTQAQPAARAVRNRKEYFKRAVEGAARRANGRLRVLDLGSGPCRDVLEFLEEHPELDVRFTCVDQDPDALRYAADLCSAHRERIEFVQANVLRFQVQGSYDLVWSAGVMDYLDARAAVLFLAAALRVTEAGGEVVIGNFSPDNPNRDHIEVLSRWYLHHRGPRELMALGEGAGFPLSSLRVGMESEGINLFLHAGKGPA